MSASVDILSFVLNGEQVVLNGVDANVTLNEWIRSQNGLTGTKKMCGEGGCGCCVVAVKKTHPVTQEPIITGINSVRFQYDRSMHICIRNQIVKELAE